MTTAEMTFAPGGGEATDRKQEARKVLWAFLAAIIVHLVIAYSIAASSGMFSSPIELEDKPMELTFVDLSTPAPVAQKNTMFVENDESKNAPEPKDKTFESNANSIAASQQPATGGMPLPSQEGKDRPAMDLETHDYALAQQGAQAQPSVAPQETPQPSQAPTAEPTPPPEQFAMLTKTPTPPPQSTPTPPPQPPRSLYQAQKQQTRLSGSITNRGAASVNALGTPLGRYQKNLYDAIGSRWYAYVASKREMINIGTLRVVFSVDRSGRVKNLKIIENTSNESFANVCLQSVMEINLPPIPEDVANTLPPEGLDEEMSFTMYAN